MKKHLSILAIITACDLKGQKSQPAVNWELEVVNSKGQKSQPVQEFFQSAMSSLTEEEKARYNNYKQGSEHKTKSLLWRQAYAFFRASVNDKKDKAIALSDTFEKQINAGNSPVWAFGYAFLESFDIVSKREIPACVDKYLRNYNKYCNQK